MSAMHPISLKAVQEQSTKPVDTFAAKQKQAAQLADDVAKFLANGGEIEVAEGHKGCKVAPFCINPEGDGDADAVYRRAHNAREASVSASKSNLQKRVDQAKAYAKSGLLPDEIARKMALGVRAVRRMLGEEIIFDQFEQRKRQQAAETKKRVLKAVELKLDGLSPTEIGRRLGVSDSMARKYLKMAVEA